MTQEEKKSNDALAGIIIKAYRMAKAALIISITTLVLTFLL